jgi:hypothetical protein
MLKRKKTLKEPTKPAGKLKTKKKPIVESDVFESLELSQEVEDKQP